VYRKNT